MNKDNFIKSKTIEAAQRLARFYGVERPIYTDFTLEQANTVNQALTRIPKKARPEVICSFETLWRIAPESDVFHRDGESYDLREISLEEAQRKSAGVYTPLDHSAPGCGKNAIAFNLMSCVIKGNFSFVVYHEMAHAYAARVMGKGAGVVVPLSFYGLAKRWCEESGISTHKEYLENGRFSEIWADAWSLYHSDYSVLPDYIVRHIEQFTIR